MSEPSDTRAAAVNDVVYARFPLTHEVTIRPCRASDLPALEWFGLFAAHRPLIAEVFAQHQRGEAAMLVAEVNGEASGQCWIELQRQRAERSGEIWAVRLLPCLQGRGLGERLMDAAHGVLLARGFREAEVAVEFDNPRARRFYERLGYRPAGVREAQHPASSPDQERRKQWVLRKVL